MVLDHNICLAIGGGMQNPQLCERKAELGRLQAAGEYGDHNIIDRRGAEGEFVKFDPANFVFDLRLKAGATAIGAGSPVEAPAVDITGAARGNPVDIGAYRYNPNK